MKEQIVLYDECMYECMYNDNYLGERQWSISPLSPHLSLMDYHPVYVVVELHIDKCIAFNYNILKQLTRMYALAIGL